MSEKKVKVRVLRTFRNKYSKSLHKRGDLLVISEKRIQEINSAGHGKLVEPVKEGGCGCAAPGSESISEDNLA